MTEKMRIGFAFVALLALAALPGAVCDLGPAFFGAPAVDAPIVDGAVGSIFVDK